MTTASTAPLPPALPEPYATPPSPRALRPTPATVDLVRGQVRALLLASPTYASLGPEDRRRFASDLVKIASYAAECVRDDWYQSERIGQRPLVRKRETIEVPQQPTARAQETAGDQFRPAAAGQVARITQETLRAIAFPAFVADLINSTFNAIVDASIRQMEAYGELLSNVGRTVDDFMSRNISDNQARDWLQSMYPEYVRVVREEGRGDEPPSAHLEPAPGADERPPPPFRTDLGIEGDVGLDESSLEEKLVPAARRRLAQSRLQTLSTMVLMGVNRIVVTGGKLRATMGFHIDAHDRTHAESASELDTRMGMGGSVGWGPWSVQASMSVAYVSSSRADSDSEINVETDLTSEVEIHFKSDYFPIERFADSQSIGRIRGNTAVPEANQPVVAAAAPASEPAWGDTAPPRERTRLPERRPSAPPIGTPMPGIAEPTRRPPEPPPVRQQPAAAPGAGAAPGAAAPAAGAAPGAAAPRPAAPGGAAPGAAAPPAAAPGGAAPPAAAPGAAAPPAAGAPAAPTPHAGGEEHETP